MKGRQKGSGAMMQQTPSFEAASDFRGTEKDPEKGTLLTLPLTRT